MAEENGKMDRSATDDSWVEKAQFGLIFVLAFSAFLVSTTVSRLMPWRWGQIGRRPSIFATASEAAGTVSTFAFMG